MGVSVNKNNIVLFIANLNIKLCAVDGFNIFYIFTLSFNRYLDIEFTWEKHKHVWDILMLRKQRKNLF